jgi:hypothetical protein
VIGRANLNPTSHERNNMNSIRTTTAATLRQNLTPLLCAAALLCAGTAFGQKDDKPRPAKFSIAPIKSRPYGKSYGQWGAEWWRWALSFPAESESDSGYDR